MIELQIRGYGPAWAVFHGGKAVTAVCPAHGAAITLALDLARTHWEAGEQARVSTFTPDGHGRQVAIFGDRRQAEPKAEAA